MTGFTAGMNTSKESAKNNFFELSQIRLKIVT